MMRIQASTRIRARRTRQVHRWLPTARNTHDVAQAAAPDSKVAYVDKDPMVVLHADALLAGGHDVIAVRGDAAEPAAILADPRVSTLIQPGRPCAVILAAVLHFFPLAVARRIITELAGLAAPGSYLIISVGSSGSKLAREYAAGTLHDHSPDEIRTLLTGLEMIDPPGLVDAVHWAPRTPAPAPAYAGGRILAAVARMPGTGRTRTGQTPAWQRPAEDGAGRPGEGAVTRRNNESKEHGRSAGSCCPAPMNLSHCHRF